MGLPAVLMLAGIGMQAWGQKSAGDESAAVAKYNQQVKEREAQAAEQRAKIESRKQALESSRKMSELRAGLGASGAVTTAGAPLEIMAEQSRQSDLSNREIGYEGLQESATRRAEGVMIAREGRAARRAGRIGAGATLLTGFGSVLSG